MGDNYYTNFDDIIKYYREHLEQHKTYLKKINMIPFLGGRPERETDINNDDILNLKIALETSKDITELCKII